MIKEFDRVALSLQPSPLQLSEAGTLGIVTRSSLSFHLLDLVNTASSIQVSAQLSNELANLVLYDEDISVTTNISDTVVSQLRWLGPHLYVLTNNLNLLILLRASIERNDYHVRFNVNRFIIEHCKIQPDKIIKYQHLLKLRLHSFALMESDIYSRHQEISNLFVIGLENGKLSILQMLKNQLKMVLEDIQISDQLSVLGLTWSKGRPVQGSDNLFSYILASLSDNSVVLVTLTHRNGEVSVLEIKTIKTSSKYKVSMVKFFDYTLSIVSTNSLKLYDAVNESEDETELKTYYAINDICNLVPSNPDQLRVLLINSLNYIAEFEFKDGKIVPVFTLDYNSNTDINNCTNISPTLKRHLLTLHTKYTNISIRGVLVDPLGNILTIGFANNDPPIENRRQKQTSFKISQILLDNGSLGKIDFSTINFDILSAKYIVNLVKVLGKKGDLLLENLKSQLSTLTPLRVGFLQKNTSLTEFIKQNLEDNSKTLSLLQLSYQLNFYLHLELLDPSKEILKFISLIFLEYVKVNDKKLTDKYDCAIYQSYKALHGIIEKDQLTPIGLEFGNQIQYCEDFKFDDSDLNTIVSLNNEIPFKRCSVTLLPLLELNNYKCDSSDKTVTNLQNLKRLEEESLTTEWLTFFNQKCVYSGDYLYRTY